MHRPGVSLKLLYVTYSVTYSSGPIHYSSHIAERIGDLIFMFNYSPYEACDGNFSDGIRCYEDSVTGFYHFLSMDSCTYTYVGINPNKKDQIMLYPNPANDKITIQMPEPFYKGQISIQNLNGQIIMQQPITSPSVQIDVSTLPCGVYVVKVMGGNGVIMRELVKE